MRSVRRHPIRGCWSNMGMRLRSTHPAGTTQGCACMSLSKVFFISHACMVEWCWWTWYERERNNVCGKTWGLFLNPAHLFCPDYDFCMRGTPEYVWLLRLERQTVMEQRNVPDSVSDPETHNQWRKGWSPHFSETSPQSCSGTTHPRTLRTSWAKGIKYILKCQKDNATRFLLVLLGVNDRQRTTSRHWTNKIRQLNARRFFLFFWGTIAIAFLLHDQINDEVGIRVLRASLSSSPFFSLSTQAINGSVALLACRGKGWVAPVHF